MDRSQLVDLPPRKTQKAPKSQLILADDAKDDKAPCAVDISDLSEYELQRLSKFVYDRSRAMLHVPVMRNRSTWLDRLLPPLLKASNATKGSWKRSASTAAPG
jgi:hypothetical protein